MIKSIALRTTLEMEMLTKMNYGDLNDYHKTLEDAIATLENLKKDAVMFMDDKKAVEYQECIYQAITNKDIILVVMLAKEGDMCEHFPLEKVWLS